MEHLEYSYIVNVLINFNQTYERIENRPFFLIVYLFMCTIYIPIFVTTKGKSSQKSSMLNISRDGEVLLPNRTIRLDKFVVDIAT